MTDDEREERLDVEYNARKTLCESTVKVDRALAGYRIGYLDALEWVRDNLDLGEKK